MNRPYDYEREAPFGASLLRRLLVALLVALLLGLFFIWALGRAVDQEYTICRVQQDGTEVCR